MRHDRSTIWAGAIAAVLAVVLMPPLVSAQDTIKTKHLGASRGKATPLPRTEGDQALVDGWPLYRTERGQAAFNDAMATLKATDFAAPSANAFRDCAALECHLALPALRPNGWLPPGRVWVSPSEYVLIAHSPRQRDDQSYRRRMSQSMRVFVFHEFHNSSRNTDMFDTVSSHSGSVFVPLYMSKQGIDARGHRYVIVLQVAPHDVFSVHASNMGSAGPGVEVAKNVSDALEPLQGQAGIIIATMLKTAVPHLQVVNHRGTEGLPMLNAYNHRQAKLRARPGAQLVALPYMAAPAQRVGLQVAGRVDDVVAHRGASARIPVVARGFMQPQAQTEPAVELRASQKVPARTMHYTLVEPVHAVPRLACGPAGGCR